MGRNEWMNEPSQAEPRLYIYIYAKKAIEKSCRTQLLFAIQWRGSNTIWAAHRPINGIVAKSVSSRCLNSSSMYSSNNVLTKFVFIFVVFERIPHADHRRRCANLHSSISTNSTQTRIDLGFMRSARISCSSIGCNNNIVQTWNERNDKPDNNDALANTIHSHSHHFFSSSVWFNFKCAICVRPKSDTYVDVFSRFIFIKFTAKNCILLLNSRKQIILSDLVSFDVAFLNFFAPKKTHMRTNENHYAYKMTFPDNNKDRV